MQKDDIDEGNDFDFGKTSLDYSKYRDIYPKSMYQKIFNLGIGHKGQKILDLGTGTGVFPRAMYKYGGEFTGIDISKEQIEYAKKLSEKQNMNIMYKFCSAESTGLNSHEYDVITAVQCFIYFDKLKIIPEIIRLLKKDGKMVIVWMGWLPFESKICEETIKLVLKYNPKWIGGENKNSDEDTSLDVLPKVFETIEKITYTESLKFTYETWAGRIRACRGVSASLPYDIVNKFNKEHLDLLKNISKEPFEIPHEIKIGIYKLRDM